MMRSLFHSLSRRRPSPALLLAILALVAGAGGVGFAAIPDRGGVIHACFAKRGGNLRVVDTARRGPAGHCRKGERTLAWNRTGLPGVPGSNGANGTDGVPGRSGATNVAIRFAEFKSDSGGLSGHVHVDCQNGERAVGGGIGWTQSPGSGDAVTYSGPEDKSGNTFPDQGGIPTGWAGQIKTSDGKDKTGRVYAVCASP